MSHTAQQAADEIDRLRKAVEDWHDSATRAEREVERIRVENDALRKCCTQRSARMQIMRDWMDSNRGIGPPTEWWYFCEERPEAGSWFDADGVPVDA